jgi:hypothetical protein
MHARSEEGDGGEVAIGMYREKMKESGKFVLSGIEKKC